MLAKKQGGKISWLIACGSTVIARVGGAAALAGLDVDADGVNQANVAAPFYLVASRSFICSSISAEKSFSIPI